LLTLCLAMKTNRYLVAAMLGAGSLSAHAMDLMEAWQATLQHDPQVAISQASRQAGDARRTQASALWRPTVTLSATAGAMNAETATTGAHFSAPGLGSSDGVGFATSVDQGNSTRWSLSASQPLINLTKKAQSKQLEIAADVAEFEWQAAQQELLLKTAQKYFDVVLLESKLSVLRAQQKAVDLAATEAKDRFSVGDKPITDTHEATARAFALQAQVLTAQNDLELAKQLLTDATGVADPTVQTLPPQSDVLPSNLPPLPTWVSDAAQNNPTLRMMTASLQAAQQETAKFGAVSAATLDLVAQAGRDQISGNGGFGSASNTATQQMIGLQMNIPLYTGGYRSAKLDETLRLQEKAAAELERARQQTGQQMRAAWLAMQTGSARLGALAQAHKASLARLDATRIGRQVGDRTTLELLQAENDASGAELALLQARVELLINRLQLQALAGQLDARQLAAVNALLRG
jgi:outer membrane protein